MIGRRKVVDAVASVGGSFEYQTAVTMAEEMSELEALTELEYEYQHFGFSRRQFVVCLSDLVTQKIEEIKLRARNELIDGLNPSADKIEVIDAKLNELESFFLNNSKEPLKRITSFVNRKLRLPKAALPEDAAIPTASMSKLKTLCEETEAARRRATLAAQEVAFLKQQILEANTVLNSKLIQVSERAPTLSTDLLLPPAATFIERRISLFSSAVSDPS